MRVYFNFHCYIQNKPIAKMFIAIVNTCSMCILYCCLLLCSHGEHHQESRLPCHTNTKQPASMHQLELQSSWLLTRVLHERIEWHCFRQCKKTQATITSSRVCSGVMKHCHDRGRDQGRSTPSAALHVVCTNRVALLQRLLCWPTV